jgi:rhodanese-related sulfurtransferase
MFYIQTPAQQSVASAEDGPAAKIKRITPEELKEAIQRDDVIIVDVRDEKSWQAGHIKGAKRITGEEIIKRAAELDRNKLIVTYCSCPEEESSILAALLLQQQGFQRIAALLGGYKRAASEGISTERIIGEAPTPKPLPSNVVRGKARLLFGNGNITVEYDRPAANGRTISELITICHRALKMNWNAPPYLTTNIDLKFGDQVVRRGRYYIYMKTFADMGKWALVVAVEERKGGRKELTTVAQIPLVLEKMPHPAELATIKMRKRGNNGKFILEWGILRLSTDFQKA